MALSAAGKRAGSTERARWKCGRSAMKTGGVSANSAAFLNSMDLGPPATHRQIISPAMARSVSRAPIIVIQR